MLPRRRSTSRRSSLPQTTDPPAVSPTAVAPGEAERSLTTPEENELPAIDEKIESLNRETDPGIVATPLEHKPGAPQDIHSIDQPDNLGKAKAPTAKKPADELLVKNQDAVGDIKEKFTASKSSPIWDRYVKMTEEEDRDVLEDWEGWVI
ncbi:unnamed protein product [Rhizoctonia solani]|uniref:Uncharacterized protein n=1 Tax=Rhizoctonia solani TaxID=456999 RepID=A0A8H3E9I2_9AGAM|nr:unnamed protein product [Rhizoctonia solani]